MTGLYPSFHRAHETKHLKGIYFKLDKDNDLITKYLKEQHYDTFLFTTNPHITQTNGYKYFDYKKEIDYIPIIKNITKENKKYIIELNNKLKTKSLFSSLIYRISKL